MIQIIKQTNFKLYMHYTVNCKVQCTIRNRTQSARSQQRKRTSEESEMVTYKHVNEVARIRCVKHQANRVDSGALPCLIATLMGI